jgi:low affinity Fe/Cu permease
MPRRKRFNRLADRVADAAGTSWTFFLAAGVVLIWLVSGPLFHFSDTWQLVINTATTIVTFLMTFLIQATQNRDARAMHLKLDELIRAHEGARNYFADLEEATEEELTAWHEKFKELRAEGLQHRDALREANRRFRGEGSEADLSN